MEIVSGSRVRIKKGSIIKNTLRGYNDPYEAQKSYVVKVHSVSNSPMYVVGVFADDGVREGFFHNDDYRYQFNKWLDENGLTLLEEAMEKIPERFSINKPYIYWIMGDKEICWVGTGGYWHYTSISNVDLVEGN